MEGFFIEYKKANITYFPLTPYVTLMLGNASIKTRDYEIVKKVNALQKRNGLRYVIGI